MEDCGVLVQQPPQTKHKALIMVNVKKRKGRVVIDSDSEDSASDDNLDQVRRFLRGLFSALGVDNLGNVRCA